MNLRLWDYDTCECGKNHRDWPITDKKIPKTIQCECGKRVGWVRGRQNQIHLSHSALYGRTDPRTGETYADYGEKQADFRRRGLIEGDVERVEDIENEIAAQEAKRKERDPNVVVADGVEELQAKLYKDDRIDWSKTGDPTKRGDTEAGLLDSWRNW